MPFLEQLVRGIGSPAQVPPAGRLVLEAPITRAQRQTLLNMFAASLDRVSGSARVFAANESGLIDLEYAAMRAGLDLTALAPALRSYLARHVGGPRCSDSLRGGKAPEAVEDFNAWVARLNAGGADFLPISAEEARPLRDGGTYALVEMWKSPRSRQVLAGLRWLNHGNRDLPGDQRFWTLEQRSTNEWNARYLDFLKLIEGWKEEEEPSPQDYFMMKADAYSLLADLAPPGPRRDAALGNFMAFLEQQYALVENHNLWFMEFDTLLRKARDAKDPRDRAYFLNAMLRSANPVIALYTKLQEVAAAQRPPQR